MRFFRLASYSSSSFFFFSFFFFLPLTGAVGLCWETCHRSVPARAELAQTALPETSIQVCFEKTKTKKEMNKQEGDAGLGLGGDFLFMFRRGVRVPNCGLLSKGHKRAVGTRDNCIQASSVSPVCFWRVSQFFFFI